MQRAVPDNNRYAEVVKLRSNETINNEEPHAAQRTGADVLIAICGTKTPNKNYDYSIDNTVENLIGASQKAKIIKNK